MARKSIYIEHEVMTPHDDRIVTIRRAFGLAGYGAWWSILEYLRMAHGCHSSREKLMSDLIFDRALTPLDQKLLEKVLSNCLSSGLLVEGAEGIFSPRLCSDVSVSEARSDDGKRGNDKRWSGRRIGEANRGGDDIPVALANRKQTNQYKQNTGEANRLLSRVTTLGLIRGPVDQQKFTAQCEDYGAVRMGELVAQAEKAGNVHSLAWFDTVAKAKPPVSQAGPDISQLPRPPEWFLRAEKQKEEVKGETT